MKVVLYANKEEAVMRVQCHLGENKVIVAKSAGEQACMSIFAVPKVIAKNSNLAVSSMIDIEDYGTRFQ